MDKKGKKIASVVIATAVAAGLVGMAGCQKSDAGSNQKTEKCYGIAKKAKNDCGTKKHACAGQSTKASQGDEWIYVLKGNCERIVGGNLDPKGGDA